MIGISISIALAAAAAATDSAPATQPSGPAYLGIWHGGAASGGCGGGAATWSPQHVPMAQYVEAAGKTFFVYGGTSDPQNGPQRKLQIMAAHFDHHSGTVSRPTLVAALDGNDPAHNPTLTVDGEGHIWVFLSAVAGRGGGVFRSSRPHEVNGFDRVSDFCVTHPQPWHLPGGGFMVVHGGEKPGVYLSTSRDGRSWGPARAVTELRTVSACVSAQFREKLAVAFATEPDPEFKTGAALHYVESRDGGRTWTSAGGQAVALPIGSEEVRSQVSDYGRDVRVVLKDLAFNSNGQAGILYLLGRRGGSQWSWAVARWAIRSWDVTGLIVSDHPCDSGCLNLSRRDAWYLFGPTEAGPQPGAAGGGVAMWESFDAGRSWAKRFSASGGRFNANNVRRPVNAHGGFFAFWTDGDPAKPSMCQLYFATEDGKAFVLPTQMPEAQAAPQPLTLAAPATRPRTAPASQPAERRPPKWPRRPASRPASTR